MDLHTEIDTGLELLFEERTEDPCEHSEHSRRTDTHSGFGEWLVRVVVDCCEKESHDILVCDRFKQKVVTSKTAKVYCSMCIASVKVEERYVLLGRKGVDF